jgi:hypothetical protein
LSTVVKSHLGIWQFSISSAEITKSLMDSQHVVVKCWLKIRNKLSNTHALIDSRAMGIALEDEVLFTIIRWKSINYKIQVS